MIQGIVMFYVLAAAQHGHRQVDFRAEFHKADCWLLKKAYSHIISNLYANQAQDIRSNVAHRRGLLGGRDWRIPFKAFTYQGIHLWLSRSAVRTRGDHDFLIPLVC